MDAEAQGSPVLLPAPMRSPTHPAPLALAATRQPESRFPAILKGILRAFPYITERELVRLYGSRSGGLRRILADASRYGVVRRRIGGDVFYHLPGRQFRDEQLLPPEARNILWLLYEQPNASNREIASMLGITPEAVAYHISRHQAAFEHFRGPPAKRP